jgi:hypothetical protein
MKSDGSGALLVADQNPNDVQKLMAKGMQE